MLPLLEVVKRIQSAASKAADKEERHRWKAAPDLDSWIREVFASDSCTVELPEDKHVNASPVGRNLGDELLGIWRQVPGRAPATPQAAAPAAHHCPSSPTPRNLPAAGDASYCSPVNKRQDANGDGPCRSPGKKSAPDGDADEQEGSPAKRARTDLPSPQPAGRGGFGDSPKAEDAILPIGDRLFSAPSPSRSMRLGPMPQTPPPQARPPSGFGIISQVQILGQASCSTAAEGEASALPSTVALSSTSSLPSVQALSSVSSLPAVPETVRAEELKPAMQRRLVEVPISQQRAAAIVAGAPPVPATFAQPSTTEPTEEIHPPARPVASAASSSDAPAAEWKSKALFAAPPESPPAEKPKASKLRPPATGQQSWASAAARAGAENAPGLANGSIERGAQEHSTPVKVSDRIRMFEKNTTPSIIRQPGFAHPSSSAPRSGSVARAGTAALGSAGPSSAAGGMISASGVVDGSSLFTPQQRPPQQLSNEVKPKELFRSASDMAGFPKPTGNSSSKGPPRPVRPGGALGNSSSASSLGVPNLVSGQSPLMQPGIRGPEADRLDSSRNAQTDACERLASGSKRDNVAKPKSLRAAEQAREQARLQEEKRVRERHEREQERERARAALAAAAVAPVATVVSTGGRAPEQTAGSSGVRLQVKPGTSTPQGNRSAACVPAPKKGIRRSAVLCPDAAGQASLTRPATVPALPLHDLGASATADAASSSTDAAPAAGKVARPPVPAFRDPAQELRNIVLPPKSIDDNYELSECGGDSDEEEANRKEHARASKRIPRWCDTYMKDIQAQANIDPDTIWGRVPHCDMDSIFSDALYQEVGKNRPRRHRGSSGNWQRDRLTRTEIRDYKSRMGQKRCWEDQGAAGLIVASGNAASSRSRQ